MEKSLNVIQTSRSRSRQNSHPSVSTDDAAVVYRPGLGHGGELGEPAVGDVVAEERVRLAVDGAQAADFRPDRLHSWVIGQQVGILGTSISKQLTCNQTVECHCHISPWLAFL